MSVKFFNERSMNQQQQEERSTGVCVFECDWIRSIKDFIPIFVQRLAGNRKIPTPLSVSHLLVQFHAAKLVHGHDFEPAERHYVTRRRTMRAHARWKRGSRNARESLSVSRSFRARRGRIIYLRHKPSLYFSINSPFDSCTHNRMYLEHRNDAWNSIVHT